MCELKRRQLGVDRGAPFVDWETCSLLCGPAGTAGAPMRDDFNNV